MNMYNILRRPRMPQQLLIRRRGWRLARQGRGANIRKAQEIPNTGRHWQCQRWFLNKFHYQNKPLHMNKICHVAQQIWISFNSWSLNLELEICFWPCTYFLCNAFLFYTNIFFSVDISPSTNNFFTNLLQEIPFRFSFHLTFFVHILRPVLWKNVRTPNTSRRGARRAPEYTATPAPAGAWGRRLPGYRPLPQWPRQ